MSSTNRGRPRAVADFYPTPAWCLHRLLEAVPLPGGRWCDPCAGNGAMVRAAASREDVRWTVREVRPEAEPHLAALDRVDQFSVGDAFGWDPGSLDVVVTNPPYRDALSFVNWGRAHAPITAMLLRLNFLGTAQRVGFLRAHPPDVFVLPDRPSFDGVGHDSIEYAWFVWRRDEEPRDRGAIAVLASTPLAERSWRAARAAAWMVPDDDPR